MPELGQGPLLAVLGDLHLFGSFIKHVQDLPFSISVLEADEPIQARHLYNAEIVMAAADEADRMQAEAERLFAENEKLKKLVGVRR